MAFIEQATGRHVPTFEELVEIESSSRLRARNGALYLSASIVLYAGSGHPLITPVGFVLTPDRLMTVRFEALEAFDNPKESAVPPDEGHPGSAGAFAGLMEAIVDRMVDALERVGAELKAMSHGVFEAETGGQPDCTGRPGKTPICVRFCAESAVAAISHPTFATACSSSAVSSPSIVPYVTGQGADWLPAAVKPRLETLHQDIASLADYDTHLANKVQLLLDATLGLISIEQKNIMKVPTFVSVVGVPPTLVASFYGMNFRYLPELGWDWGYVPTAWR